MTLEEDLARAEKAVKQWELAVRFHANSPAELLKKAEAALHRATEYRNRVLYEIQTQSVHEELTALPWLEEDL